MSPIQVLFRYNDPKQGIVYLRVASKTRPNEMEVLELLRDQGISTEPIIHIDCPESLDRWPDEQDMVPAKHRLYQITVINPYGNYWRKVCWSAEVEAQEMAMAKARAAYLEKDFPKPLFWLDDMPRIESFQNGKGREGFFFLTVCSRLSRFLPTIKRYIPRIEYEEGTLFVLVPAECLVIKKGTIAIHEEGTSILFHDLGNGPHFHCDNAGLSMALEFLDKPKPESKQP